MTEEQLLKAAKQELEWLRYYGHVDSRLAFTSESELYRDLQSIGYTKKNTPLDLRCAPHILTSNSLISEESKVDELFITPSPRDHGENRYTPLEVVWILFPEKRQGIVDGLK
jgi:hypothetical protein